MASDLILLADSSTRRPALASARRHALASIAYPSSLVTFSNFFGYEPFVFSVLEDEINRPNHSTNGVHGNGCILLSDRKPPQSGEMVIEIASAINVGLKEAVEGKAREGSLMKLEFLMKLNNETVSIELKNGIVFHGTITIRRYRILIMLDRKPRQSGEITIEIASAINLDLKEAIKGKAGEGSLKKSE